MMEKEFELQQEISMRIDDYDEAVDAASGTVCPSGDEWEDITVGIPSAYTCRLFMARDR